MIAYTDSVIMVRQVRLVSGLEGALGVGRTCLGTMPEAASIRGETHAEDIAMTTVQQAAATGLATLSTLWDHGQAFQQPDCGGCFWMAANAYQAAIDQLCAANSTDTYGFTQDALIFFESKISNPDPTQWPTTYGYWVDDYAWWGIAFLTAYIHNGILGLTSDQVQKIAKHGYGCWQAMQTAWDPTSLSWTNSPGQAVQITGGIPNTTGSGLLAGRNCVTNESYWRLCQVLNAAFNNNYDDPKTYESDFFIQALNQNILFDGDGLVLQRFLGLPPSPTPNFNWLGDQGLFAICCFFNVATHQDALNVTLAQNLIATVSQKKTLDGVLHEDLGFGLDELIPFRLDYACGKGTFMRNLAPINVATPAPGYHDMIWRNAVAVWKNRLPDGQFPYYWNAEQSEPPATAWGGYVPAVVKPVLHAAGLSAITAALPFAANNNID
jgi:hypothetical protein